MRLAASSRQAGRISSPATIHGMHIYAADVQAIAESITALTVVGAVGAWTLRTSKTAVSRLRRRQHKQLVQVLSTEVASGPGWEAVSASPEVSLEAGIAYARAASAAGHPPYVATRGAVSPDDRGHSQRPSERC